MASQAAIEAAHILQTSFRLPEAPAIGDTTEAYKARDKVAYVVSQLPCGTKRPLKIICIGAGFSGLSFAREIQTGRLENVSLTVYEKNASVGGTWYENRYPGCACDIPIHNYQFSWAPYPHFPCYYAAQQDIYKYIEKVADQHHLRQYIKTSHKIIGAEWNEERQKWRLEVVRTDGRELMTSNRHTREGELGEPFFDECDIFINATGCFNDWKWPNIPGRETFRGGMLHSAIWPKNIDLSGKTVALIGNGSTGVQILPSILGEVKKICVYVRSKTWVTAGFAQKFAGPGGSNVMFSEDQKKTWKENPDDYLKYRKAVESELNSRFRLYLKYAQEQKEAREFSVNQMSEKLSAKPEIIKNLIPDFAVGCRRATPGNGYLEALGSDKVEIVWGEVDSFDTHGIRSASGAYHEFDSIICATGFGMSFSPRFSIIGKNEVNLQREWDANPECYLSVTAANMPNYFMFLGPGSPLGHGSVVSSIERVTEYISKFINKLQTQNYSSVVPKAHIPRAYQKQALAWLEKTAWISHCASTYKNGKIDGPIISLHPGSRLHFFELLLNPRWEDLSGRACNSTKDLTWFLPPVPKEDFIKPDNGAGHKIDVPEVVLKVVPSG